MNSWTGLAALALGAATVVSVLQASTAAPGSAHTGISRVVRYDGLAVAVPRGWPVRRFAPGSSGCVRLDRHAVYLGQPAVSTCPPHIVGQVATVQILRGTSRMTGSHDVNRHGLRVFGGGSVDGDRVVQADAGGGRVVVTTGAHRAVSDRIVTSVRELRSVPLARTPHLRRMSVKSRSGATPSTAESTSGLGFDACTAPSLSTMQAWNASPYRTLGVYVGGVSRGCAQANLTSSWVSSVSSLGWTLIPTYVGLQAPCTSFSHRISAANAAAQGTSSAKDAIADLTALGLGTKTPVYFDMEAYSTAKSSCVKAVETFLDAWTVQLHASGYLSGVYSSAASGVTNLVQRAGDASFHEPDDLWFAHWNNKSTTTGDSYVPDALWPHHRIHQYAGGHNERYGGVTIDIDNDAVDADTATANPSTGTTPIHTTAAVNIRPGPGTGTGAPLATMPTRTSPTYNCWTHGRPVNGVDVWWNVTWGAFTGYYSGAYDNSKYASDSDITTKYGVPQCVMLGNSARPTVTGTAQVGSTLTATGGTWTPDGVTLAYQWLRGGFPIGGATQTTYRLAGADRGSKVTVRVTASMSGYASRGVTSTPTAAVAPATMVCPARPQVSGRLHVGRTVTASGLACTTPSHVTYHYRWLVGGKAVRRGIHRSFRIHRADRGKRLAVNVTATSLGYLSVSRTSASHRIAR
jgi:hypothetical protein